MTRRPTPPGDPATEVATAAYIAIGLDKFADIREVALEKFGHRHIDRSGHWLVMAAIAYAPRMEMMWKHGDAICNDAVGVWCYEMPEEFGAWYCKFVAEHDGNTPTPAQCHQQMYRLAIGYFVGEPIAQSDAVKGFMDMDIEGLPTAIRVLSPTPTNYTRLAAEMVLAWRSDPELGIEP